MSVRIPPLYGIGIDVKSVLCSMITLLLLCLQVHKAVMTIEGVRRVVAVKVRHPGVADIIRRDFQVMPSWDSFHLFIRLFFHMFHLF